MSHITVGEANAWFERTKLSLTSFDPAQVELEEQISSMVLGRLAQQYDVSGWTDYTNTPKLVRTVIAMQFSSQYYNIAYSDDDETTRYAFSLMQTSNYMLTGLLGGQIVLVEVPDEDQPDTGQPSFYPTDASSMLEPTVDDPSLGPPVFTMGHIF